MNGRNSNATGYRYCKVNATETTTGIFLLKKDQRNHYTIKTKKMAAAAAEMPNGSEDQKESKGMTPLEVMGERNSKMHCPKSIARGRDPNFEPRSSDVFIVTYPKCGTTWVTQIAHSLRTRGSMDFDEITEVNSSTYLKS
jgi:hypothetical protein